MSSVPGPRRVLLVEDDPGFQLLIQRILERMDPPCTVETVEGGTSMDRQLAGAAYDLLLLDYSLPGRSGLDVLRDLKAAGNRVPVVMVTGMGSETVAVDALKLGAYDYLVKSGDLRTSLPLVVGRVIEKVRLEDGLRRYSEENERLRELDRLKSQFIANVSHELRTPLVSIAGYTEMLLSAQLGPVSHEQRRALQVCGRNAERLRVLIDNILSLSSLETHKVRALPRPTDLGQLVEERLGALRQACGDRGISLSLDRPQELPPVQADPDLIDQVVGNLLGNALKFTPDGGAITVTMARRGTSVEVAVADTGCGIAPEHLDRIFERFWQADAGPTRRYPGLGIGLAIVREILEAHAAPITVESRVGAGSVFRFELARATAPAAAPTPPRAYPGAPKGGAGRVVLVVDDEADTREFVMTALEMAGHRVILAAGGRDALAVLRRSPVDVVLLDVAMPDMSGMDVLREMRHSDGLREIPVVMLTAIAGGHVRDEALRAGAAGIVDKPLRTSTLLASLDAAVEVRPS